MTSELASDNDDIAGSHSLSVSVSLKATAAAAAS